MLRTLQFWALPKRYQGLLLVLPAIEGDATACFLH